MNTFRSYADYEIPLLQVLSDLPGGQGTSREVRDRFGEHFNDRIPDEHRVYLENAHVAKWRNMVAWVRNTLINRGLMDSPAYGIWRITDAGRAYLAQAGNSAPFVSPSPTTQSIQAPDRTVTLSIGGQSITLSAGHVLATARREIARGLPPAARNFHSWVVEVDGQQVGVKWLFGLATGMSHADFKLSQARRAFERIGLAVHRSEDVTAIKIAVTIPEDQQEELSKLAFIQQVRAALDGLLASAGLMATLKTPWEQLVHVDFAAFSGCHYAVWVHAHTIEVGLHFQTSRKLNYARLEWFHPHREALSRALGEQVRAEKWGENAARIFYELSRPPLSATVAAEFAGRLIALIQGTLPLLREAFVSRTERPRIEAHSETPTRAHVIIDTQIVTVRDFLNGRAARPSDERLCDWVHLCYEFELYREGRELFALVDPAQVNPWYYERTKRLAKVCAMKVAGHA
jgi:hypothetical protein